MVFVLFPDFQCYLEVSRHPTPWSIAWNSVVAMLKGWMIPQPIQWLRWAPNSCSVQYIRKESTDNIERLGRSVWSEYKLRSGSCGANFVQRKRSMTSPWCVRYVFPWSNLRRAIYSGRALMLLLIRFMPEKYSFNNGLMLKRLNR